MAEPTENTFSYKNAAVGVVVGISIGLGLLDPSACIAFSVIFALIFGYKEPLEKVFIGLEKLSRMIGK